MQSMSGNFKLFRVAERGVYIQNEKTHLFLTRKSYWSSLNICLKPCLKTLTHPEIASGLIDSFKKELKRGLQRV